MPRINRKIRIRPQNRSTRAQLIELLLGPNGATAFDSPAAGEKLWLSLRDKLSPAFATQWYAAGNNTKNYAAIAHQYARDVVAGVIPACVYVKQACQRHLNDLARSADPAWPYRFDEAKANRPCRFIELLPHVKGNWAARDERILLEPWQVFIVCSLFGWVKKATGMRRFTLGYVEVARKNAKSTLAAGIGDYMLACDGEFGAEVYSGATTEDQALEVFRPARQMLERSPELARVLGVTPAIKKLVVSEDGSRFEPVIGKPGDGASPTCGVVDEYHEHDSDALFDTLRTGMGARQQPIELVITTAGDNLAGPCKLLQGDILKVLDGSYVREEVFGIIYSIDATDVWSSDLALVKANPNIDVSVFREFLIAERDAALRSARKQGVFKTKHLCVWVGASAAYFNAQSWKDLGDPSLKMEHFLGCPCVCAIDLSTKNDMTARAILFKKIIGGKDHYYIFMRFYIPEAQVLKPENQHYQEWVANGHLIQHSGSCVDFADVENEAVERIREFKARELCFDPFNAAQFSQNIARETRADIVEIDQRTAKLSPPTKDLDVLIGDSRVHHEGNPVMNWMIGNVVAHEDKNENVFPHKPPGRDEQKIDGAIAAIMGISRLMVPGRKQKSVYSTRGLLSVAIESSGVNA